MERSTLTKSELATLCEVSTGKVRQWCNVDYYDDLVELGYRKYQKVFTPQQTAYLRKHLIDFKE